MRFDGQVVYQLVRIADAYAESPESGIPEIAVIIAPSAPQPPAVGRESHARTDHQIDLAGRTRPLALRLQNAESPEDQRVGAAGIEPRRVGAQRASTSSVAGSSGSAAKTATVRAARNSGSRSTAEKIAADALRRCRESNARLSRRILSRISFFTMFQVFYPTISTRFALLLHKQYLSLWHL